VIKRYGPGTYVYTKGKPALPPSLPPSLPPLHARGSIHSQTLISFSHSFYYSNE
jgi:hypothetical protein